MDKNNNQALHPTYRRIKNTGACHSPLASSSAKPAGLSYSNWSVVRLPKRVGALEPDTKNPVLL